MSSSGIDLSQLPALADADTVEDGAKTIHDAGQNLEDKAGDIESSWRGLEYSYSAPETDTLLAALLPTKRDGETVKDNAKTVYDALKTYADTERDLKDKLRTIKSDVGAFESSIAGNDEWEKDENKINERNGLIDRINGLKTAHDEAANTCATKISGIFGGVQYRTMPDDGAPAPPGVEYNGMSKDMLNSATAAGETPWATNVEWDKPWYRDVWDGIKDFGSGMWESVKGAVTGTLALVNPFDWDTFSSTWKGIGTLALDVATVATPIGLLRGADARSESGDRLKEVGKAMINLEEWKNNPAKAAGMLTGDILLTVGTGGAGAAMKGTSVAGKAGKMASAAGKAGRAGGARAIDFSKALAKNPKVAVGDLASSTKGYLLDSKAIYGRAFADARTGVVNAGFKTLDKVMPTAAAAVNTINRFDTFTRNAASAAVDATAAIKMPGLPSMGRSPALAGVPDAHTMARMSPEATRPGPVTTFRESFERNTAKSNAHSHALPEATDRAGSRAPSVSESPGTPLDPQSGRNAGPGSTPLDGADTAAGGKGPNGPGNDAGKPGPAGRPPEGETLSLRPKEKWTPHQKTQYDAKVKHLDDEAAKGNLEYTKPDRGPNLRITMIKDPEEAIKLGLPDGINADDFRAATERQRKAMLAKYDLDHKTDLQLGGVDHQANMQWLDRSVNRSVGAQIRGQRIKNSWDVAIKRGDGTGQKINMVTG